VNLGSLGFRLLHRSSSALDYSAAARPIISSFIATGSLAEFDILINSISADYHYARRFLKYKILM